MAIKVMTMKDLLLEHFDSRLIEYKVEEDGDGEDKQYLVDIMQKGDDEDGLRACTFVFDHRGNLIEIWHGEYKGKYEDLNDEVQDDESAEDIRIGKAVKVIANVFRRIK